MAYQPEQSEFSPVYQIEVNDPVLGGLGGIANLPLLQLANRTLYLKDALETLESGGGPFEYNPSAGTLPVGGSDGAGVMGIRRKDYYFVIAPGTVDGVTLQQGDALIAKVDDAATIDDFIVSQSNAELATPTVIGMVKLVQDITGGSMADACLSVAGLITLFAQKASPALTGTPTTSTPDPTDNTNRIANTAWVLARLVALQTTLQSNIDAEVSARQSAVSAEAATRASADSAEATARANAVSNEATARANADNAEQAARIAADNSLNSAKANRSQAAWTNIALTNGWTGFPGQTPQYMIDEFGRVHLRGMMVPGSSNIFSDSLPLGAAVSGRLLFFPIVMSPGSGTVYLSTSMRISNQGGSGRGLVSTGEYPPSSTYYYCLDSVSYF